MLTNTTSLAAALGGLLLGLALACGDARAFIAGDAVPGLLGGDYITIQLRVADTLPRAEERAVQ